MVNSLVATAYPVEDHYEVLTPTVDKMSSFLNTMAGGECEYGAEEHVATLWHEAFHCWQFTNYLDNIESICPVAIDESMIAEHVDTNEKEVSLYEQQSTLLKEVVMTKDVDKIKENILEYKKLDEERKALLSNEENALEDYYIRVEGTACYIEACVSKLQQPADFDSNYIETINVYGGGSGKYYKMGMSMCMILDVLDAEWKENYDFSEPLMNLIYEELEIGYGI